MTKEGKNKSGKPDAKGETTSVMEAAVEGADSKMPRNRKYKEIPGMITIAKDKMA